MAHHAQAILNGFARRVGVSVETMLADRAGAMTGAIANPTCGSVVD